ncbi:hypothetical protein HYW73_03270 [Candidatus Nomurabacteria bacterium]|nr:hypothetical protein [Candidatus Nomurabacteria bacterium]
MKKSLAVFLEEWFVEAVKSGRDFLTVPPRFTKLSCGCTREPEDKEFRISRTAKGSWIHHVLSCKDVDLDLPKVRIYERRSAVRAVPVERHRGYFFCR